VREDLGTGKVARLIGVDQGGVSLVSWLRVRRMLQAETPEDRLIAFRRLVQQMNNKAPLRDLANCLLDWSQTRRRNFVFDFHSPSLPAASTSASATQEIIP
jgi:CRISPR system Cascade subunit CasB